MTISEALYAFKMHLLDNDRAAKTHKAYETAVLGKSGISTFTGDVNVDKLGLDHILGWKLKMRSAGLKPAYINLQVSCVRQLLKWLAENECRVIDYRKVTFDKQECQRPYTTLKTDEVLRLLRATKTTRDRAIIALLFGTGCRSSEILGLDREDWHKAALVDEVEGVWEMYVLGKNKKYRPVCFFQNVRDIVDCYLASRTDNFRPLFISQQNRRIHFATVSQMLHDVTRRAGMQKRVTQHVFRHSYATDMSASGMPLPVLAYSLGHSSAAITQRVYVHINAAHSRKAYPNYHPGKELLTK